MDPVTGQTPVDGEMDGRSNEKVKPQNAAQF